MKFALTRCVELIVLFTEAAANYWISELEAFCAPNTNWWGLGMMVFFILQHETVNPAEE